MTYAPGTYGDRIADIYDALYGADLDTEGAVERLAAQLPPGARVLDLGAGNGRLAAPLAARGFVVDAVEASAAMIEQGRARSGDAVRWIETDIATFAPDHAYDVILAAFSTWFVLPTQDVQVATLQGLAPSLKPSGRFVLDAFVPNPARFEDRQSLRTRFVDDQLVVLDAAAHHPAQQRLVAQHVILAEGQMRLCPVQLRYAWPSELDLMARLAGLELESRHADWRGAPFTDRSEHHVSSYRTISPGPPEPS